MERHSCMAVSVLLCAGAAVAQTVYPPLRINPRLPGDEAPYYNTAVASVHGSRSPLLEVVAATTRIDSPTEVFYAISHNNGLTYPYTGTLALPPGSDQAAMAYPTAHMSYAGGVRRFWLGASGTKSDGTTGVYLAWRLLQSTVFDDAWITIEHTINDPPIDRPLLSSRLAMTNLFASFVEDLSGCCINCYAEQPSAFMMYSADLGQSWTDKQVKPPVQPTFCDYRGRGPVLVERTSGGVAVVAADVDVGAFGGPPHWLNNEGRPFATWSQDLGVTWTQNPVRIGQGALPEIEAPEAGDAIAIDGGALLPYAGIKRNLESPDEVYVLFAAKSSPGSSNLDLYIAWSRDAGASFVNSDILHLTELMLHGVSGDNDGPDQIPAGLAVDSCGGLHISWYDTIRNEPGAPEVVLDVYWAFIDEFGTPNQTMETARLTSTPFSAGTMASPTYLGERQSLTTAQRGNLGLWVYPCYAMVEDGLVNSYVSRVKTFHACVAPNPELLDADPNGLLEPQDLTQYTGDWLAEWPNADMDYDGDIDADDYQTYLDAYNSFDK